MTRAEAASLFGWWLEAGVDSAVTETPRDWLKKAPQPVEGAPASDARSSPGMAPARVAERGETLEAFHAYLRHAGDLPLFRAGVARVLPHGPAHAEVMLVSDLPGRDASADDRPISGEAWQLMVRMLAAIGLKPEQAYVASLACFPSPTNRLEPGELTRCAEDMNHHISLVQPRRLLLLGDGPARALTGQAALQARGRVHRVGGIPAVVTLHPRQLLQRPSDKAHAWRDLLLLMTEEVA